MIAYYFPPLGGAGVQRSAKFAKYLARLGWRLEVVAAAPSSGEPLDWSLERDINLEQISVHRVSHRPLLGNLNRLPGGWRVRAALEEWLIFPDRMRGWMKPACKVASAICAAQPGIPVLTTSAPYTAHLIGLYLKQRYRVPWIADFRDEWSQNPYWKPPTPYHRIKHQNAEKLVLTKADAVVSVTNEITEGLRELVPGAATTFATIPNGFDPEDLLGLAKPGEKNPFTITHVGTLNQERFRLLKPLLNTLQFLIETQKTPHVQLKLVGSGNWGATELRNYRWLETVEYLPHHQALVTMAASNLVILAEANPAAFTGKIFEYLGLKIPILGIVRPASPAAALIREAEAGWVFGLNHDQGMAEVLLHAYRSWEDGTDLLHIRENIVQKYNREFQAGELSCLLHNLFSK